MGRERYKALTGPSPARCSPSALCTVAFGPGQSSGLFGSSLPARASRGLRQWCQVVSKLSSIPATPLPGLAPGHGAPSPQS